MLLRLALSACNARIASSPEWVSASLSSSYASSPSSPSAAVASLCWRDALLALSACNARLRVLARVGLRLAQLLVRVVAVQP